MVRASIGGEVDVDALNSEIYQALTPEAVAELGAIAEEMYQSIGTNVSPTLTQQLADNGPVGQEASGVKLGDITALGRELNSEGISYEESERVLEALHTKIENGGVVTQEELDTAAADLRAEFGAPAPKEEAPRPAPKPKKPVKNTPTPSGVKLLDGNIELSDRTRRLLRHDR
jgi:hypothetical protein